MPRQTKLTPGIHQAIVQAVTGGMTLERAASLVEIDPYVVREWVARGEGRHHARSSKEPYATFARDIKKALATDEARRLLRINQAGQGGLITYERTLTYPDGRVEREIKRTAPQWQADAWHLERCYPERYARTVQKVALTDPSGEQSWEPTVGLAALLEAARKRLTPTNGQHVPQLTEGEISC
jgi:hypothetical protein